MAWTTPDDVADQLQRLWRQGQILAASLTGEPLFPLALRFRRPDTRELSERFDAVRAWIRALEDGAKPSLGFGYDIAWEETSNRQLGRNRLPVGIAVPARQDALALIGKAQDAGRFDALARSTMETMPQLQGWLARKPLTALDHAEDWPCILKVLTWFQTHPCCGLYLRQADIAGVDTKFIETRKGLLAELLDLLLRPEAIDPGAGGLKSFESRYGLRTKPILIRFRILDETQAIAGFTDLTVPITQFAALASAVRRVFVTENEVNGLAFPPVADSLVIFGLGYSLALLAGVPWLQHRDIHYWGDIDTHGFAMLDQLRSHLPHARSLLMDRETLVEHWQHRSVEDNPFIGNLERLTLPEKALYDDLRYDRLGRRVRLEQERIGFGWLERALADLCMA